MPAPHLMLQKIADRPAAFSPPEQFEEYRLVRLLGQGAMGQVYLAHDTLLDRPVAIKFMAIAPEGGARERFFTEARAIARLCHQNVVSVHRVGEVRRRPYLVSEYVRGVSLAELPQPQPAAQVMRIGLGLSRGLGAAHRRGVLHRDVKPANAMISEDGQLKLLDFGLAKLLDAGGASTPPAAPHRPALAAGSLEATQPLGDVVVAATDPGPDETKEGVSGTAAGALLGTPLYMAPEAWRGEPQTPESDIYSLGVVLYELCAGRPPYGGATTQALRRAVLAGPPAPLRSIAPHIDEGLCAVIDRCLRPGPADRYAGGDALCEALLAQKTAADAALPEGNPYRGLLCFEAAHRGLFFGRGAEVRDVLDRLRLQPFVLVCGDSGVGKSSLCRAGVLPAAEAGGLDQERALSVLRVIPGRGPLLQLSQALAPLLGEDEAALCQRLRTAPQSVLHALRARLAASSLSSGPSAAPGPARLLLFVDQMEELVTLADPAEAAAFDEVLGALGSQRLVRILATVRSDFLVRLSALPWLGAEIGQALYLLRPLLPAGVREAVVGPAQRMGFAFESERLVDELCVAAKGEGGLPLLQFALSSLWEARDRHARVLSEEALAALGGVTGALARHGDGVLLGLLPAQRTAARRLLLRLVTAEGTRARRSEAELCGNPANLLERAALSALVRGRLLVAREEGEGSAYEIAHEALLLGWPTLRGWLAESEEARAARQRLEQAAAEWSRIGHMRSSLWNERQLKEAAVLGAEGALPLPERERRFLHDSRNASGRRRLGRLALLFGVPISILLLLFSSRLEKRLALERQVGARLREARGALSAARAEAEEAARLRKAALSRFDAVDQAGGERGWEAALLRGATARKSYGAATASLDAALLLDSGRADVRGLLAAVYGERALLAEGELRGAEHSELIARLQVYSPEGAAAFAAPAELRVRTLPPDAQLSIQRYERKEDGRFALLPAAPGAAERTARSLAPGSYLLSLSARGHAPLRYPVRLRRGERLELELQLLPAAALPSGFVYIPPGRTLFGATVEEGLRRDFYYAAPLHEVKTAAYLIAEHETTWADWIAYLQALPEAERTRRTPRGANYEGLGVELSRGPDGRWQIALQPKTRVYRAQEGVPIRYEGRTKRAQQDWLRMPVSAVSFEDAAAYADWLRRTGRVPGARLCTDIEWERAARGADEREFPHGDRLDPDDANFDLTYGRVLSAAGPDEVGSHRASDSPFGIADMAGNIFEWTRSSLAPGETVVRGASFLYQRNMVRLFNREPISPETRTQMIGVRLCADASR